MPLYPKTPLEEKLAWMRQRQKQKEVQTEEVVRQREPRKQSEQRPEPPRLERPGRKMMRVSEVAEILGVSTKSVQRWFRDRAVLVRPGLRRTIMLISEQVLDEWIAEHTPKPQAARRRV